MTDKQAEGHDALATLPRDDAVSRWHSLVRRGVWIVVVIVTAWVFVDLMIQD